MAKKPIPVSSPKNLSESGRTIFHHPGKLIPCLGNDGRISGLVETRNRHLVSTWLDPLFSWNHHVEHGAHAGLR